MELKKTYYQNYKFGQKNKNQQLTKSFKNDYNYGKKKEIELFKTINDYFGDNITLNNDDFALIDYTGNKYIYELKSRNCSYSNYPTTLIPYNKICDSENKNIILLFNFTDGLYYIKYDEKIFNSFELNYFVRNKRIDYDDKSKLYYYIPINKLIKIN